MWVSSSPNHTGNIFSVDYVMFGQIPTHIEYLRHIIHMNDG